MLKRYTKGSLVEYIDTHQTPPAIERRWQWVLQAADILARCHEKRVMMFDIALRNFLIADDFSLRLINFTNSTMLEDDDPTPVTEANVFGLMVKVDLLHLSNVVFSIMAWKGFSISCDDEAEWPTTDQMPDVCSLGCGEVVRKCWAKEFANAQEMIDELQSCAPSSLPDVLPEGALHAPS